MKIGSIRMLRHFIAASKFGNLHKAANSQSLTQSAITKSIKQLEDGLGVQLFDRTTKGVTLTNYGRALHSRARRVEAECEWIEKELTEMASGHAGRLTIGAGSVWSSMFLPRALSSLHRDRPAAEFTVIRSSGTHFAEQFESGEIDIGLGATHSLTNQVGENVDGFICETLSEISTAFFAHHDHPLHKLKRVTPEDLCFYPNAMFRPDLELQQRVSSFFATQGLQQPHPAVISDSISGVMATLKGSTMITCLPLPLSQIASLFGVHPVKYDISPWTFSSGLMYPKIGAGYPLLDDLIMALRRESNTD